MHRYVTRLISSVAFDCVPQLKINCPPAASNEKNPAMQRPELRAACVSQKHRFTGLDVCDKRLLVIPMRTSKNDDLSPVCVETQNDPSDDLMARCQVGLSREKG